MPHPASDSQTSRPQSASHSASETVGPRRAERGVRPSSRRRRSTYPQRFRSVTGAPNSMKPSANTPTVLLWPSTCEQQADEPQMPSTNRGLQNAFALEISIETTANPLEHDCSGSEVGKTLGTPCVHLARFGVERSALSAAHLKGDGGEATDAEVLARVHGGGQHATGRDGHQAGHVPLVRPHVLPHYQVVHQRAHH